MLYKEQFVCVREIALQSFSSLCNITIIITPAWQAQVPFQLLSIPSTDKEIVKYSVTASHAYNRSSAFKD